MPSSTSEAPPRPAALRVEPVGRARWLELAASFADHNYRQTWDFGVRAAARVGATSEHVALRDGARVLGIADVRVRRLPLVGGGIAYVTGGPLTRSGGFDVERYAAAAAALREEYAGRRGLVLRIAAPVGPERWNREVAEALTRSGFQAAEGASSYRTMLLDVARSLGDIRRTLRQKWRNCLNRAERSSLTVRSCRDVEGLRAFRALFDEFVVRKGFHAPLGADFYGAVQADLPESERFHVLLAERDGRVVAGHLSSALGDTLVYLLGATAPEALPVNAAYLLQWRAIELARERGCAWYDLGGVDPEGNPGVHHFKEGLGGSEVTAAGPVQWHAGPRSRLVLALEAQVRAVRSRGETRT